jgi:hypothetical protein
VSIVRPKAVFRLTSSARRNQQQSPLLRLPAELRERIYSLVYDVTHVDVCTKLDSTVQETKQLVQRPSNLFQACRQAHYEWEPHRWKSSVLVISEGFGSFHEFANTINTKKCDFSNVRVLRVDAELAWSMTQHWAGAEPEPEPNMTPIVSRLFPALEMVTRPSSEALRLQPEMFRKSVRYCFGKAKMMTAVHHVDEVNSL